MYFFQKKYGLLSEKRSCNMEGTASFREKVAVTRMLRLPFEKKRLLHGSYGFISEKSSCSTKIFAFFLQLDVSHKRYLHFF